MELNFKGKEIDEVLRVLKKLGGVVYPEDIVSELPKWQQLKAEAIFR